MLRRPPWVSGRFCRGGFGCSGVGIGRTLSSLALPQIGSGSAGGARVERALGAALLTAGSAQALAAVFAEAIM